jgi:hypothetical protein
LDHDGGRDPRGNEAVAIALANERTALRPDSLPNKHFVAEAEKLAS